MLCQGVDVEQHGAVLTVKVRSPELEPERMRALVDGCLERMRYHGATVFLLDLEEVEYLSSPCLGPLVELLQDLEGVRGRIGLVACQPSVASVFRVTRLDTVFGLYDDIAEARASV